MIKPEELSEYLQTAEYMVTRMGHNLHPIGSSGLGLDEQYVIFPLAGDHIEVDKNTFHDALRTRYGAMISDKDRKALDILIKGVSSDERSTGFSYIGTTQDMMLQCVIDAEGITGQQSVSWNIVKPAWKSITEKDGLNING